MKFNLIYLLLSTLALLLIGCNHKPKNEDGYSINGTIKNYDGFVFLSMGLENKTDSTRTINGTFQFKGTVSKPIEASIFTKGTSAASRNFFIENTDIEVDLNVEIRKIGEHTINWIIVKSVEGTEVELIEQDFLAFKNNNQTASNYNMLLYNKIEEVISKNTDHPYSGSLLHNELNDSVLTKEQGISLFKRLDTLYQDEFDIQKINEILYPSHLLFNNSVFEDFSLVNKKGKLINTHPIRKRKYLFIDFWASWCPPCVKEIPRLKEIRKTYSKDELEILGVSIDTNKEAWLKALQKYQQPWHNVIDTLGDKGALAKKYKINAIPFSLLIDPEGRIIETGLYADELEQKLDSVFTR